LRREERREGDYPLRKIVGSRMIRIRQGVEVTEFLHWGAHPEAKRKRKVVQQTK